MKLGAPQGRSGRVRKIAPSGFDLRNVQPLASRYTEWAIAVPAAILTGNVTQNGRQSRPRSVWHTEGNIRPILIERLETRYVNKYLSTVSSLNTIK
jgi:hypothetical protein